MRDHKHRILIINPGSTATKIAVFENDISIFEKVIQHDVKETESYKHIIVQYKFRKNDITEVEKLIDRGNKKAQLIYSAMAYQIAKEIGAAGAVLAGQVDAIILTGILAARKKFVEQISTELFEYQRRVSNWQRSMTLSLLAAEQAGM